jgi:prephenate dehydrogenase
MGTTLFRQLTICGVGLIGGSFAITARKHRLVEHIVGLGRTKSNLDIALARGLVDTATNDPVEAARNADLVMLATPVMTFPATLTAMIPHLPEHAVVTDVGSVKGWVVQQLEPLLRPPMSFVGVHPVAGRETTGAGAAEEGLFVNHRVIVTPSARSKPDALEKVERLWRATGARIERMSPAAHDAILARASHLPQIVSSTLACALCDEIVEGHWAAAFGAGGLRDTTRIAASSAEMWRDICLTNSEAITDALRLYREWLDRFEHAITTLDEPALKELFLRGRRTRERIQ